MPLSSSLDGVPRVGFPPRLHCKVMVDWLLQILHLSAKVVQVVVLIGPVPLSSHLSAKVVQVVVLTVLTSLTLPGTVLARFGTVWHGLARSGTVWHGLARSGTV